MANEAMWTNRCHNRGPCHNCPGAAMDYPVFLGPSDSPICVVAQDPNYTINAAPAERLHSRLLQLARNHAPWQQLEPYIWECRSLDPENQLARVRRRVAEAATYPVEQVYFTNLAKCGRRGAYRTGPLQAHPRTQSARRERCYEHLSRQGRFGTQPTSKGSPYRKHPFR